MGTTVITPILKKAGRILFPLLEHASIDDDPSLQALWARMLANAATGYVDVSSAIFHDTREHDTSRGAAVELRLRFEQSHGKTPFVAIPTLSSELDTPFDQLVILLIEQPSPEGEGLWVD